jgi:molybdopterin molybdotransferase
VAPLSFQQAREDVLFRVRNSRSPAAPERVSLAASLGRVLAEDIAADRDTPALSRSVRDGFALRASDAPGELRVVGEVRAGGRFDAELRQGEAIEIMTGAPMPPGADSVVMVERVTRASGSVRVEEPVERGRFVNPRACEAAAGDVVLHKGHRIDYAFIAALAAFGRESVSVYRKPSVAIIATGDEIVAVEETPADHQIRNSNAYSLAAQVRRAGGEPLILPLAPDTEEQTRGLLERGLAADLLLLSGGVSAGKYDFVKRALANVGAEVYFDRVLMQPGQPVVFGCARGRFFFGLPGNPGATMVTFEVFARSALELLAGCREAPLAMPYARLTEDFRHKPGITRFLPAALSNDGSEVRPLKWSGSGDIPAISRAGAYLVAEAERPHYRRADFIRVLTK